jgi:ubiquinone/menaquinone biosynthesis C-methylase UbiE
MLQRVLEPEVMDSPAEAADYDSMDHREVNRRFVDDLLAACDAQLAGVEVLDLGTGTAQIPIELCRRRADARVAAVDYAAAMLDVARRNVAAAGLSARIELVRCDAKRLPHAAGRFAIVMSNSIVHHIPDPRRVLAEAVRVVRPRGMLFFRDLLRPPDDAEVRRLVATYAADANARQRQMFDDSLRAALSLDEIRALVADLGFDPAAVRQTSDRHWTWSAVTDDGGTAA